MIRCEEVQERLVLWIDGKAADPVLSRHIERCSDCAERAQTIRLLGQWTVEPAPFDLMARLEPRPRRWIGWAAAAALLIGLGITVVSRPRRPLPPPLPGPVATLDASIARHVQLACFSPGVYPYTAEYEESLSTKGYAQFAVARCAAYAKPPSEFLPRGTELRRREGDQSVYWTPLGELSIFRSAERTGPTGIRTVLTDGHEIKVARFLVGDDEVTLLSEGLPWPELDRIREGLSRRSP